MVAPWRVCLRMCLLGRLPKRANAYAGGGILPRATRGLCVMQLMAVAMPRPGGWLNARLVRARSTCLRVQMPEGHKRFRMAPASLWHRALGAGYVALAIHPEGSLSMPLRANMFRILNLAVAGCLSGRRPSRLHVPRGGCHMFHFRKHDEGSYAPRCCSRRIRRRRSAALPTRRALSRMTHRHNQFRAAQEG